MDFHVLFFENAQNLLRNSMGAARGRSAASRPPGGPACPGRKCIDEISLVVVVIQISFGYYKSNFKVLNRKQKVRKKEESES